MKTLPGNDGTRLRALIYARVSTKEQVENQSLDTQERLCHQLCEREGFEVFEVFREEGESAKTAKRTQFQRLLSVAAKRSNRIRFVVFYALDRFMRNAAEFHAIRGLLTTYGVNVRYVMQPTDDSPTGRFTEGISALVAQLDNEVKGARTRDGLRETARLGRWVSKPPIGYLGGARRGAGPSLVLDPVRAPFIRRAFELLAAGRHEKAEILAKVTAEGFCDTKGRAVAKQAFDKLLRNPVYSGRVVSRKLDVDVTADFEPIVTAAVFETAQGVLQGRRVSPDARTLDDPRLPLRRFVRCAHCGTPVTGSFSTGRGGTYGYYRCRLSGCAGFNASAPIVEEKFVDLLRSLEPRREYLRAFGKVVLAAWRLRRDSAADEARQLAATIERLHVKKRQIVDALIDGRIAKPEYDEALAESQRQIGAARVAEQNARSREVNVDDLLAFAERILTDVAALWLRLDARGQRALQLAVFPRGVSFDGEVFRTPEIASVFTHLRVLAGSAEDVASPGGFEPPLAA